MTLSAVSLPYYRHILPYAIPKFKRFAVNVWNINAEGKATEQVAQEGLSAMEDWMREIGVVLHLAELGVTEDMLESIADVTLILKGGYHVPNRAEIIEILKEVFDFTQVNQKKIRYTFRPHRRTEFSASALCAVKHFFKKKQADICQPVSLESSPFAFSKSFSFLA